MPVGTRVAAAALAAMLASFACAAARPDAATGSKAFTVDDLVRLRRLTDPQASPDGHYVAFVLRETDMDANRGHTDIWLLDLAQKHLAPRRLTTSRRTTRARAGPPTAARSISSPAVRVAHRCGACRSQAAEATQVTDYPLDIGSMTVAPHGDQIAVSMEVFPDCVDLPCTKDRPPGAREGQAYSAHLRADVRSALGHVEQRHPLASFHRAPCRQRTAGVPVDVSRSLDADVPSKPFGGDEDFAFSPDGSSLVFSARIAGRTEPWSTNFDLFQVPVDGSAAPRNLTTTTRPGMRNRCFSTMATSPGSRRIVRDSSRTASTSC